MKYVVWGLVGLLLILHQDFWFWNNASLVWGVVPITLVYHAGLSIAAGVVWYLATRFAWPENLDEQASTDSAEGDAVQ